MASLRFVSQKLISPTAQADLQAYLTTLQSTAVPAAVRAVQPYLKSNPAFQYAGVLYGNAFSGEQGFASIGKPTVDQSSWDVNNNLFPSFSMSKTFTAVVFAKMVEEGLISQNDLIKTYISTGFNGTMSYITNGSTALGKTPININSSYNPADWTVTTGSFDASALTLNCLLNWNFGMFYDGFQYGINGQTFGLNSTGVAQYDAAAGTEFGKNIMYNMWKGNNYILANSGTNFIWQILQGNDVRAQTSYDILLQQCANGVIPLAFKPNVNTAGSAVIYGSTNTGTQNVEIQPPYFIPAQLQQYSINYDLLAYAMDVQCRRLYAANPVSFPYANWAAYSRAKIITPLGMTRTFVLNQEQPSLTSPVPNIPSMQYDPTYWMCAPQLTRGNYALLSSVNPLFVNYPANLLASGSLQNANIATAYYGPYGSAIPFLALYGTGSTTVVGTGALPGFTVNVQDDSFVKSMYAFFASPADPTDIPYGGIPLMHSFADYGKLLSMIINGGKNSLSGQRIMNKETVEWLFGAQTDSNAYFNSPNNTNGTYGSYAKGFQQLDPNSKAGNAIYPMNKNSWVEGGGTNINSFIDLESGYYCLYGSNCNIIWSGVWQRFGTAILPDIVRLMVNKNA